MHLKYIWEKLGKEDMFKKNWAKLAIRTEKIMPINGFKWALMFF